MNCNLPYQTVPECRWKILRVLRPPKLGSLWAIVLSCPLIGSLSSSTADQRAAQNNYWALGFQDLCFSNFVTYNHISNWFWHVHICFNLKLCNLVILLHSKALEWLSYKIHQKTWEGNLVKISIFMKTSLSL